MEEMDNKKLVEAARMLKEHCEEKRSCNLCPFNLGSFGCSIGGDDPDFWPLPKPRRFTDTDILWAKAAKASGAKEVTREVHEFCSATFSNNDSVDFPNNAFASIQVGESVPIDEILKEGDK